MCKTSRAWLGEAQRVRLKKYLELMKPRPANVCACARAWARPSNARQREARADHAVAGNESSEVGFGHAVASCGSTRQHEIAHVGIAVVDAHLDLVGNCDAEFGENGARLTHRPAAVGLGDVPAGWLTQERARIARAQGAHDEIVQALRVLHDHQLGLLDREAKFRGSARAILEQPRFVIRIAPSARPTPRKGPRAPRSRGR
jgi:hypothetical protein